MKKVIENESESNVTVTVALVKRVSDRVAMGIPLDLALAGEPVTRKVYEEQLRQHPELAALVCIAKREFLEEAMKALFNGKKASANIRWWLTCVYPEIFGKSGPREEEAAPERKQTIRGVPEEDVEAAQRYALEAASARGNEQWKFREE